jgi:hypothetical protein
MTLTFKQEFELSVQQLGKVIAEFIRLSPSFEGDCKLASQIGEALRRVDGKVTKLSLTVDTE